MADSSARKTRKVRIDESKGVVRVETTTFSGARKKTVRENFTIPWRDGQRGICETLFRKVFSSYGIELDTERFEQKIDQEVVLEGGDKYRIVVADSDIALIANYPFGKDAKIPSPDTFGYPGTLKYTYEGDCTFDFRPRFDDKDEPKEKVQSLIGEIKNRLGSWNNEFIYSIYMSINLDVANANRSPMRELEDYIMSMADKKSSKYVKAGQIEPEKPQPEKIEAPIIPLTSKPEFVQAPVQQMPVPQAAPNSAEGALGIEKVRNEISALSPSLTGFKESVALGRYRSDRTYIEKSKTGSDDQEKAKAEKLENLDRIFHTYLRSKDTNALYSEMASLLDEGRRKNDRNGYRRY